MLTDELDDDEDEEDVDDEEVEIEAAELPLRTPRAHREMANSTTAEITPKAPPPRSEDDEEEPEVVVVTELASSLRKGCSPR